MWAECTQTTNVSCESFYGRLNALTPSPHCNIFNIASIDTESVMEPSHEADWIRCQPILVYNETVSLSPRASNHPDLRQLPLHPSVRHSPHSRRVGRQIWAPCRGNDGPPARPVCHRGRLCCGRSQEGGVSGTARHEVCAGAVFRWKIGWVQFTELCPQ